jgi:Fur family ferric uptake transcriptional regulator
MNNNSGIWLDELHANGYRLTEARRAVVATVSGSERALTPVQVYDAARERYPALGLVTVYRTLEKLEELGLIQRVHHELGCQAFLPAGEGHQHLLLCSRCGRAALFSGDDLSSLFQRIAEQTGYQVQGHWLQVYGVCADCQKVEL